MYIFFTHICRTMEHFTIFHLIEHFCLPQTVPRTPLPVMHMCVWVYVCIVCVYECMCVSRVCMSVYVCVCTPLPVIRVGVFVYRLCVCVYVCMCVCVCTTTCHACVCVYRSCVWVYVCTTTERWGAGVETQKNLRGEIGGWGRVPFNEPYAPSLSTIYDGA